MVLSKVNRVCFKAVCSAGTIVLAITGVKILSDNLYVRGMIVLVSAATLSLLLFQKPSLKTWLQVLAIAVIALITINNIAKI